MIIIQTSFSNKNEAKKFALELLATKMSPCINITDTNSLYMWQNKVEDHKEFSVTIKTIEKFKKKIIEFIKRNHSYDVPEIIVSDIKYVENEYKKWLKNSLKN